MMRPFLGRWNISKTFVHFDKENHILNDHNQDLSAFEETDRRNYLKLIPLVPAIKIKLCH